MDSVEAVQPSQRRLDSALRVDGSGYREPLRRSRPSQGSGCVLARRVETAAGLDKSMRTSGLHADVRLGTHFDRFRVQSRDDQEAMVDEIKRSLAVRSG